MQAGAPSVAAVGGIVAEQIRVEDGVGPSLSEHRQREVEAEAKKGQGDRGDPKQFLTSRRTG